MSLSPGTKLGPYEVIAPLGVGGMGEVYRARDPRLGRDVAIKVSAAQFTERFEREARAVAALNHPNICTLYDVGPKYLVMELVEGVPLKGPLPVEKAVEYAGQILDALDAAHRKGITHRDLKPANILVTKQGIKLLDFGLAKQQGTSLGEHGATLTRALTSEGQILGTLQYMSPEQLQGKDADARSDIFAFGCVLYEMLSGKRTFEGSSAASVIAAILEREPAPLDVTPPLDRIIRTCLAKNPDDRFQTAREVKLALEWSASAPVETGAVTTRKVRPWPWMVAAVATAAALAIAGMWAVPYFRHTPPVEERAISLSLNPPEDGQFVFGNSVGGIALSPDGRTATFVAARDGNILLWVMELDGSPATSLPGTEGAAYPFWSPDNGSIAFFSRGKLRRVERRGGEPLPICDVTIGRGGVWMSDHRILYGSLTAGLFVVPDSAGTPLSLTTPDTSRGEISHRWPQVLPGGRFLYWVQSGKADTQGIYAASLARPTEAKMLVSANANGLFAPGGDGRGYLLWLRGGTLVAREFDLVTLTLTGETHQIADPVTSVSITNQMNVAVSAGGLLLYSAINKPRQFTWIDRAAPGKKPLDVIGEPGEYGAFRLSPDRRRIAATRDRPGGPDICLLEVERGVANPFTFPPDSFIYPIWSPTGLAVLFTSYSTRNLYRKDSDGAGAERRLTQSPNSQYAADWSGDGRWILYWEIAPNTQRDLWVQPMTPEGEPATDAKPRRYLSTAANESWGRFSPEPSPHWVAYQSDESGPFEVYIDAFPQPRGKKRISTAGGTYPLWGPEGRELFYVSPDSKVMVVDLKVTADSVKPSAPRELFPLPAVDMGYSAYDVTPDGQRFLVLATPEHGASQPLTVIVNWPALLKDGKR
jgi:Tol biopolymer transport system component/predicted Ser/Thr protein kinase